MTLLTVREYENRLEGYGAKAWLEAKGLFVVLLSIEAEPMRLQVMSHDAERAQELLTIAPMAHPLYYAEAMVA